MTGTGKMRVRWKKESLDLKNQMAHVDPGHRLGLSLGGRAGSRHADDETTLFAYTMSRRLTAALLCLSFLAVLSALVSAHKITIEASKKECFFEDLHQHDQVGLIARSSDHVLSQSG